MKKRLPQNLINILVTSPVEGIPIPWSELNDDYMYYLALVRLTKTGEIDVEDLPLITDSNDYQ